MRWYLAGINTILALLCANSQAEELTEFDFLDDEPIVVSSATRLSQELQDVPASITIIDRQMIEASSAINLIELMRLVPGFQVGSIDGTESTATYHGLSSQHNKRLQILVDGRSVYQSTFGGALWYSLPVSIDEIEKIEVLRGPNAASFGANAFSAVVNISTFRSDHQPGLKIGHLGGDRDTRRSFASFTKILDRTSFRLRAEVESNTGYENSYRDSHSPGEPILPLRTGFPLYDDHFHRQLNLRIDHASQSGASHTLELGAKNLKFGGGYLDNLNDGTFDDASAFDKQVDAYYFNYLWEKSDSLLLTNRFRVSYNFIDQDEDWLASVSKDRFGIFLPDAYTRDTSFQDRRLDLEYQQNRIFSPSLQTVWGFGARYDETNSGGQLLDDSHSRYSVSTFGHIEWKQNELITWNAGGFLENHEDIGTYFSPRVALNLKPAKAHSFRANVSQAYRMPSFEAEYADLDTIVTTDILSPLYEIDDVYDWWSAGNDQLEPELMTSFEIGYRGNFFDNKLDIDIRLAKEKIEDIIESAKTNTGDTDAFRQTRPHFRWENYGEVEIDSAELQIHYRPTEKSFLVFHASYTNADGFKADRYTDFNGDTTLCPEGDPAGDPPENAYSCLDETMDRNTPQLTTGVLVSHQFENDLSISSQYSFHEVYRTGGDGDLLLTPFETLDIKVSKKWSINKNDIKASLIVRNIANEYYEDFENDNLVGREAYFQLEAALF